MFISDELVYGGWPGDFILRTVQHEHQRARGADGVIPAVLEIGEAFEIIGQRNFFIAVKIVVAQGGVNGNLLLAPHGGLAIPNLPVVFIKAVVDDVATERDKRRIDFSDGLDEGLTSGGIRGCGVVRIVEAGISIGNEVEGRADLELQFDGLAMRLRLRMRAGTGSGGEKNDNRQLLEKFHGLAWHY